MDYDTWKTTDFEGERQYEEDEAFEAQQNELADEFHYAYFNGNKLVRGDIADHLEIDESEGEAMPTDITVVSDACDALALNYDTFDKIESAYRDFKL